MTFLTIRDTHEYVLLSLNDRTIRLSTVLGEPNLDAIEVGKKYF